MGQRVRSKPESCSRGWTRLVRRRRLGGRAVGSAAGPRGAASWGAGSSLRALAGGAGLIICPVNHIHATAGDNGGPSVTHRVMAREKAG